MSVTEEQNGDNSALEGKLLLGFDFSTQQVKAVAVDSKLKLVAEERVQFDVDLPEYRTHGGVQVNGNRVTAPTIMWVKALDMLMEKLRISGIDFYDVAAISGCGQQHGCVFWRSGAREMLQQANPDKFLHDELAHAFSVLDSPVWMDSSTSEQCRLMEEEVGGAQELADITGSRAYERFSGPQIRKIRHERQEAYQHTERISLVSSFACSLFLGDFAPIDVSDAGGMNLLDITTRTWSQKCLDACAENLKEKLGDPVDCATEVGNVSEYMVERYGFNNECKVVAFTGDNCSALAGMLLQPGDVGISLGTSDTVFICFDNEEDCMPQLTGHVWPSPVDASGYMALLCYKNGSLTRERICSDAAEGDWDLFGQLLDSTPRGNFNNIGMYFDHPEIIPSGVQGDFRFNKAGERVSRFASKEAEVRALIEGQFMAKKLHAEKMGFQMTPTSRILCCGGASVNKPILQVISDVFHAPVYTQKHVSSGNSAALGSVYRSLHVLTGGHQVHSVRQAVLAILEEGQDQQEPDCIPQKDASSVYKPLIERYSELEAKIVNQ